MLPDEATETSLGYPWPPMIVLWTAQGSAVVQVDWRAVEPSIIGAAVVAPDNAVAVTLGDSTIAYLGRDDEFHPLAAVDQGPIDLKVQLLGAGRTLWSVLVADEQFQPGTSATQPVGLVLIDRGTRYLVRREFGALPAVPDTDKRETGLTRWIWDEALGRVSALSKVTAAPAYGADRFAILEVA